MVLRRGDASHDAPSQASEDACGEDAIASVADTQTPGLAITEREESSRTRQDEGVVRRCRHGHRGGVDAIVGG